MIVKGFTFYCSSIKGKTYRGGGMMVVNHLHSTVVLLKDDTLFSSALFIYYLHSTVVLLKVANVIVATIVGDAIYILL